MMFADFGGFGLPAGSKLVDKNHEMGIAHGDGDAAHLTEGELYGKFVAYLRLAHVDLKFEFDAVAAHQSAGFEAGAGTDHNVFFALLGRQEGGDAAGAIAGDFGFRAIGIEEAGAGIGVGGGKEPFYAVSADAAVTITEAAAYGGQVRAGVEAIDNQEVVAASAGFYERDSGGRVTGGIHSPSAGPRELTLRKRVDSRRRLSNACCSWRAASTENWTREWPSILAICTEAMAWCSSCRTRLSSAMTISAFSPRTS